MSKKPNAPQRHDSKKTRKHKKGPVSKLWGALRGKQLVGYRFRTGHPIGPFVADFVCLKIKLAIDIEQSTEQGKLEENWRKQRAYEKEGYTRLLIRGQAVMKDFDSVLEEIYRNCIALDERRKPEVEDDVADDT